MTTLEFENTERSAPKLIPLLVMAMSSIFVMTSISLAQGSRNGSFPGAGTGRYLLYGDVKVDESALPGKAMILDVILYTKGMQLTARQRVSPNGRYRFNDVSEGDYWLVVEFDGAEVARDSIFIAKNTTTDFQHDISLGSRSLATRSSGAGVISAADLYSRSPANKSIYEKATHEIEAKQYADAVATLRQLVSADPNDYQAWSDLGMLYFLQKDLEAAENSFASATSVKSTYFNALLNLGRVRIARKNFEGAIESLEAALKVDAQSASANFFLGEAYLQMKKGSKAVGYFNEALKLDPIGMADAHLRMATLYNNAGMKDRAAAEYEQFLQKKPDYPERKALEKYIADNKKQ
jgi:Tfp pilus assembly protein PilF